MNSTTETYPFNTTTEEVNSSKQSLSFTLSGVFFVVVVLFVLFFTKKGRTPAREACVCVGNVCEGIGKCFTACFRKCQTCYKNIADVDCKCMCQLCKRSSVNTEASTPTRAYSPTTAATTSTSMQSDNPHLEIDQLPQAYGMEPPPYRLDPEVAPPTYSVAMRDVTVYDIRETGRAESPPPAYDVIFCDT
ncbi:hypothetical protein MAR_026910 [Mya arenaria]|uniref:Uncharacterized protein n=1 Tax=Mya arenaria TaxID=6604 RepID=A0ABY7ETV9_MYAAR|nr:uncharacterized protein LOC128243918 [Mya arenaria]WAR12730.1 hypothetical protein MAR_026910 [Mya arenaria]